MTALFFTPRLSPLSFSENGDLGSFRGIDESVILFREQLRAVDFFKLFDDTGHLQDFLKMISKIQHEFGWASIDDLAIENKEICGTEEWFHEVISSSIKSKDDQDFLLGIIEGHKTPESMKTELELDDSLIFWSFFPIRILFRLGKSVSRILRKKYQWMKNLTLLFLRSQSCLDVIRL